MSAQDNNIWYFAYGSNLRELRMKERQVTYTARIKGLLHGYELVFNKKAGGKEGYGYANIQRREGATVKGALYAVTAEAISMLDQFEGYPNHYTRITIPVEKEDKETVEAVVYVAQPEHLADGLKVTDDYLDHVMSGQDIWGELFAAEVRLAAQGRAVPVDVIVKMEVGTELPVLIDGVKARIGFINTGWSDRNCL